MRSASAPGKAILLGEHFAVHGAGALVCAIERRTRVTCGPRQGGVRIRSMYGEATFDDARSIEGVEEHHRPVLHMARSAGGCLDVTIESDVPAGVGLGSSSACCVAAAGAIVKGAIGDIDSAISEALCAERTVFASASGADTIACAVGGVISFSCQMHEACEVRGSPSLVIAGTGKTHSTAEIVAAVRRRKEADEARFVSLCEDVNGMVADSIAALRSGDLVALGSHMRENHRCLVDIGVSDASLDRIVAAASATSYGAKLTGAGRGGCAIALVDESNVARTLDAMRDSGATTVFRSTIGARGLGA